jgi:uncharacterized membrane protein (UPF0127 family)
MVGLLALTVLLALPACQRPPGSSSPSGPTAGPRAEVLFSPSTGGAPLRVRVELARTPDELQRGLMFRTALEEDAGMLFLFDGMELRRFWMRNTQIPLDMIFLDDQRVVVGIEENTIPLDETGRGPNRPAQYVVEVRGGYARRHGLGVGAKAEFHNVN